MIATVLAVNAFLAAFAGTWSCTQHLAGNPSAPASRWTIAALPHSAWSTVHWSVPNGENGTAFVGYLPADRDWLYEDFHSDGSFTTTTSAGAQAGVWTWSGAFTTAERTVHGAITWKRNGNALRQGFGRLIGTSFREAAYAECRRVQMK